MILLQILKVIGIILLVVLCVLLFLILCILFYPICYSVNGFYKEEYEVTVKVRWLFSILRFCFFKNKNEQQIYLRIFGFRIDLGKNDEKPEKKEKKLFSKKSTKKGKGNSIKTFDENSDSSKKDTLCEEDFFDSPISKSETSSSNTLESDTLEANTVEPASNKPLQKENLAKNKSRKSIFQKINEKIQALYQKMLDLIARIKDGIKNIKNILHKVQNMWNDDSYRKAFEHLKKEFIYLLKKIMPSKMRLNATFACPSPDQTGQVLGILAIFPIGYRNRWKIYPDFESEKWYINGDCNIKGHIFVFQLVGILIRVIFDKNCKKVWKDFKNK